MNPAFRGVYVCDFIACVWEGKKGWGGGVYIHPCMHVCIHAETPSIPLSLSIYHASIGLSASGMRCGERGRGRRVHVGKRNKFSPPTLKMHIHFHTLKKQWGAHTLAAAVSPICAPPPPTSSVTHPPKHQRWMCVSRSVGVGENLPLAIFIFIRAEGACVFVCIHTGCVPGVCVCLFLWVCVYISSFTSTEEKRP